jgi:hypothetical protein
MLQFTRKIVKGQIILILDRQQTKELRAADKREYEKRIARNKHCRATRFS